MTRREQLQDRYEDSLFALLMNEMERVEGEKALAENERLKSDPDAAVPEEITQACMKTIRRHFAKQRVRTAGRLTAKVFGKVAMIAGVAAMLFSVAFATSETIRVNTLNLVAEVFTTGTNFYFSDSNEIGAHILVAGWVPDGYIFEEQGEGIIYDWCSYQKSEEEYIKIKYVPGDGSVVNIDTENAETENIEINGNPAMLIKKDNEYQIIWGTEDSTAFLWVLGTGVTGDELIRVANELEY